MEVYPEGLPCAEPTCLLVNKTDDLLVVSEHRALPRGLYHTVPPAGQAHHVSTVPGLTRSPFQSSPPPLISGPRVALVLLWKPGDACDSSSS